MRLDLKQHSTWLAKRLAVGGGKLKTGVLEVAHSLDRNHARIADQADTLAKASKVAAGVAVAGAVVAAPTGLAAVGVAVGLVSAPFVVTVAPVLVSAAGVAVTISAGASLYAKLRRRRGLETQGASPDDKVTDRS